MNRFFTFFLLVCFFSLKATSQTARLDSIHYSKIVYYRDVNIDSLFHYSNKLEKSTDLCQKIEALNSKTYGYYKLKNYEKAEKLSRNIIAKIDSLYQTYDDACLIDKKITALNRIFWIKKNEEKYEEAYKILITCEEIVLNHPIKDHKNFRNKLGLALNKSVIKNNLDLQQSAKSILLKAISETNHPILDAVQEKSFFTQWKANVYNGLGDTYLSLNNKQQNPIYIDSADYFFKKAYNYSKQLTPLHKESDILYSFKKTEILLAKKEYKKAIKLINNYKNISNGYDYSHREYYQKAICYHNLKKSDSAIYFANKLLKDHDKCETSKLITIYDILSNEYNKLNKLDSAYKYSKLTLDQFSKAKNTKEKTFGLFYNNSFDQAQQLNISIQEKGKSKHRNLIFSFSALLFGIIGVTAFVLNNEKRKKKELLLQLEDTVPNDVEKKEYNIDDSLETKILEGFNKMIEKNDFLNPNFSINYIAEKLKTNTTYISFVYNKHNNESFKQYITKLKIDYVVEKLKTDKNFRKYSIQAIGEEIGYTNASAFTRAFKKQVGITPSVFLKNLDK